MRYQPGSIAQQRGTLSEGCQASLAAFYNAVLDFRVHHVLNRVHSADSLPLSQVAQFYEYALLQGRRITPLTRSRRKSAGSSLISIEWHGRWYAGEVLSIFHHLQSDLLVQPLFAEIRWLKPLDISPIDGDPWMN